MAQEVATIDPDAVMRAPDGYLRVNYARLGMHLRTWDDWVAGRQRDASPLMPLLPLTGLALPAMTSQSPDQL